MTTYGVTPTGFSRKSLPTILAEIEDAAIGIFGPAVIQSPQSPMGQLNGLMADLIAGMWEIAEDVYQSVDPDQAEGARLDMLGRIGGVARTAGETDAAYRRHVTNLTEPHIGLQVLAAAVRSVPGVSYVRAYANDTDEPDVHGVPGHSVAVAVIGGTDADVAAAVRTRIVPGIGTFGNVRAQTIIDGFCRTVSIVRPNPVEMSLVITVQAVEIACACQPPAASDIRDAIAAALAGSCRLANGEDLTMHRIRAALAGMPSAEVVSVEASAAGGGAQALPYPFSFFEIGDFSASRITVRYAT